MTYKEEFWGGYSKPSSIAYLRQPAEVHRRQPQPRALNWEREGKLDWQEDAACYDVGDYGFFPTSKLRYRQEQTWRPYCDDCPVAKECLQFGRESGSEGVWGGVFRDTNGVEWDVETMEPQRVATGETYNFPRHCKGAKQHLLTGPADLLVKLDKRRPDGKIEECKQCKRSRDARYEAKRKAARHEAKL